MEKHNNILTGFGSNIIGNMLMFATTIYLTRTYDTQIYGEFRFIFSFIALSVIILLLGRDNGIIYFSQSEIQHKDTIIKEEVYFGFFVLLLGTFILFIFSDYIISAFFNKNTTLEYFQLSLLMIPLWGLFNLGLAGLKSKGLINYTFILSNLTQRAIRIPFFIVLTLFSASYYSLALGMILSQIILVYLVVKKLPFLLKLKDIKIQDFFKRFSYSIQLGFNAIIVVLLTKIDVLMVGHFTDNTQVAIYDTCVMLSFVIMMPFIALVKSSEPFMKSLVKVKEIQEKYKNNLKLSIELSLGVLLFFMIASKDILYIFGEVYMNGSDTLIVLSVSYMLLVTLGSPIEILNMNGYGKMSSVILIMSIFINIGLNILLIPIYGIVGASIATGVSLIISKLFGLILVSRKLKLNFIYQIFNLKAYLAFILILSLSTLVVVENYFFNILMMMFLVFCYFLIVILTNTQYRKIIK